MESAALLDQLLRTDVGSDCRINPLGSPQGALIRVLFSAAYRAVDAITGQYANTQPVAEARRIDVSAIVPEVTVLQIEGLTYVVERSEAVEGKGDHWRALILRRRDF